MKTGFALAAVLAAGLLAVSARGADKVYPVTVYDAVTMTNAQVLASSVVDLNVYRPDWQAASLWLASTGTGSVSIAHQSSVDGVTFVGTNVVVAVTAAGTTLTAFTPPVGRYLRLNATASTTGVAFTGIIMLR